MAEPTIYRYEVPVDDRWHTLELTGAVLHVASRRPELVEVWAIAGTMTPRRMEFRVFGTGHPLPDDRGDYQGTALAAGGRLVWHLYGRGEISTGGRAVSGDG